MSTTIKLKDITRQRLTQYGGYGDAMDDILNRIMDEVEKCRSKK